MEAKTNYTIVGILVVILIAGLISAGLWLSVGFNQKDYSLYTVYLPESAAGLSEESAVKFNGVQVGFVKEIQLNKNDPRQVEIILKIEKDTPITTSTTATLISQGITGVTYVGLSAASSNLTPLKKMPDEPYPVIPAKPSLFNQLDSLLKEVADNVDKLSVQAQRVFNEENAKHIQQSLTNLEQFTAVIAHNTVPIQRSLTSADLFLENLAKISKNFPQMMKEIKVGVENFNTMSDSISKTMDAGKLTVDQISQQTIPPAVSLLRRLNTVAANLEQISNSIRQNPSVVIRGITAPQPGPGE